MVNLLNTFVRKMVLTVARHDWEATYKKYLLALESEPDLNAAEFARRNELNINSTRRSFNKIKSNLDGGNSAPKKAAVKSDRSPKPKTKLEDKKPRSPKKEKDKKQTKSKAKAASKGAKAHATKGAAHQESENHKVFDQFRAPSRRNVVGDQYRDKSFRGVKHGAYMDIAKIDPELVDAAILLNEDDGVATLMTARYLQLRRNQSEMLAAIEESYANGQPWKDDLGNELPKSKAEGQALYGTSKPLTELESQLDKVKTNRRKLEIDEQKLAIALDDAHPMSRVQRIAETKSILAYRVENELSAVEASYLFENMGIEIPRTLAAEADKEISLRQPTKVEAEEVTAEELDQMMADYEEQREEWTGDWLVERMAGIEELKSISASDDVEVIE